MKRRSVVIIGAVAILGMLSAVYKNRPIDHVVRVFAVSGVALPAFWFGLVLQMVFAAQMDWLPTSGRLDVSSPPPPPFTRMYLVDSLLAGDWATFRDAFAHAVLPALVLSLPCLASIVRVNRSEMIEVLASDYITAARAHGVAPLRVVAVYALAGLHIKEVGLEHSGNMRPRRSPSFWSRYIGTDGGRASQRLSDKAHAHFRSAQFSLHC